MYKLGSICLNATSQVLEISGEKFQIVKNVYTRKHLTVVINVSISLNFKNGTYPLSRPKIHRLFLFLFRILIPILILISFDFGEMRKSCIDFVSIGTEPEKK